MSDTRQLIASENSGKSVIINFSLLIKQYSPYFSECYKLKAQIQKKKTPCTGIHLFWSLRKFELLLSYWYWRQFWMELYFKSVCVCLCMYLIFLSLPREPRYLCLWNNGREKGNKQGKWVWYLEFWPILQVNFWIYEIFWRWWIDGWVCY